MDLENLENQADYWNRRWINNQTGWRLSKPHDMLVEHVELIAPPPERDPNHFARTIFVPLCGNTLDVHWLRSNDYKVVACELNSQAVEEMFKEMGIQPQIVEQKLDCGNVVEVYQSPDQNVRIFRCNFFSLDPSFANVNAVFDRAALVALPPKTRGNYAEQMIRITYAAPQLLVTFEHELTRTPPYSVPFRLVYEYYGGYYNIELITRKSISNDFIEATYLLTPKGAL